MERHTGCDATTRYCVHSGSTTLNSDPGLSPMTVLSLLYTIPTHSISTSTPLGSVLTATQLLTAQVSLLYMFGSGN